MFQNFAVRKTESLDYNLAKLLANHFNILPSDGQSEIH